MFETRPFEGAENKPENFRFLILDGQQRLTSLYQSIYGTGQFRFFLDVTKLLSKNDITKTEVDFSECFGFYKADRAKNARNQASLLMPLSILKDGEIGMWGTGNQLPYETAKWLGNAVSPILSYQFPVTTLSEKTPAEAVCNIFETLNRTGVRLGVFELLTARFRSSGLKLRELRDNSLEEYPAIKDFGLDPYYFLQSIAIKTKNSCKRGDVLKLESKDIKDNWETTVKGFDRAIKFLKDRCGVLIPDWMSYDPMIITLATLYSNQILKGPAIGARDELLKRWFFCTVFSKNYESSSNSRIISDLRELELWIEDSNKTPEWVRDFEFDDSLSEITQNQRGQYKGIMCLLMSQGLLDFHKLNKLDAQMLSIKGEEGIDVHHIFPKSKYKNARSNSVLNLTFIDNKTNKNISKKDPSEYFQKIKDTESQKFNELLGGHLIPSHKDSPIWSNNFDAFMSDRERMLIELIKQVTTGKKNALAQPEESLEAMIAEGEGAKLEFKQTLLWDDREKKRNDVLSQVVVKVLSAFANTLGGTLLIGIKDTDGVGTAVGLDPDYKILNDRDKFQAYLRTALKNAGFNDHFAATKIAITFPILDGLEICRVDVKSRADEAIFIEQPDKQGNKNHKFFIRSGNACNALDGKDRQDYIDKTFKK